MYDLVGTLGAYIYHIVCPSIHIFRNQALLWLSQPVVVLVCSMCAHYKTVMCNHMWRWRRFLGTETSVLASDANVTVLCSESPSEIGVVLPEEGGGAVFVVEQSRGRGQYL